jgi:hypothetical protein
MKKMPYNVMRHADWDVAPRDPVTIGAAIITGLGGSTALATTTLAFGITVAGAVGYLATTLVTSWIMSALTPKPDLSGTRGTLVNAKDPAAPHDFVYGEVRKGGTIVYYESTGTNNKLLHQVIAVAGHEVEAISDIYINDEIVTLDGDGFVTSDPWNSKIRIKKHLGDQTTADADLLAESEQIDSSFVGNGIAYLYIRYEYDQDVFANGLPLITSVVKGKKVYDPRTDTTAYSANPALCIRDYIGAPYGMQDSDIDDVSFQAAANVCDEDVALAGGGTEDRYTMNGAFTAGATHRDVLGRMMTSCTGTLFWGGGKFKLVAAEYVAPTKVLTLDDLRGPISLDTRINLRDQFNKVQGTFNDASNRWITADYPPIESAVFEGEDNDEQTALDLELPMTTSSATAQRIAKLTLYRAREQMALSADFGLNALDVEVGEIVALPWERYGWDDISGMSSGKEFEVSGWKFGPSGDGGDLRVTLDLREISQAAFDWNAEERDIIDNNSSLPKYYEVPSIGLTVTQEYREVNESVVNVLVVQVQSSEIERIDSVIVEYKKTSDTQFKSVGKSILVGEGDDAVRFEIVGIEVPQLQEAPINYTVKVTPVNALGFRGPSATETFDAVADSTPPSEPASLAHVVSGQTLFFSWPSVSDLDLSHYKFYYNSNTSAGFNAASTTPIINKIARPATSITYPALAGKFFVSSVDKTGNESTAAATTIVLASELPTLGTTITHTESTSFDGPKTNLTASGGTLTMTSYSTSGSTGTYSFDHDGAGYFDVGTSRTVRLSTAIDFTRKHLDAVSGQYNFDDIPGNWDTWPDVFDNWTYETTDFGDVDVVVQARASTTTGGLSSAAWVSASGEIVGQYIEMRAILSNSSVKVTPSVTLLSGTVEY